MCFFAYCDSIDSIYDYSHACDDVLHDFMGDLKIVDNKLLKCMFGWRVN